MHLHTITYSSRQSAIDVARKHLGEDVVILHSFKTKEGNKAILAVDNGPSQSVGEDANETRQERRERAEENASNSDLLINNQILELARKLDALSERLDRYENPDIENVAVQQSLFSSVLESAINSRSSSSTNTPSLDLGTDTIKSAAQCKNDISLSLEANVRDVAANFREDISELINYATRKPRSLIPASNAPDGLSGECFTSGQKAWFETLGVLAK